MSGRTPGVLEYAVSLSLWFGGFFCLAACGIGGFFCLASCGGAASRSGARTPVLPGPHLKRMDLSTITSSPMEYHHQMVLVEGIVTSVCGEAGCFLNLVPLNGRGAGVFVAAKVDGSQFPKDCVGKIARVKGRFYNKVYPRSRISHWHNHGWRAGEELNFPFAKVHRIDAEWATFRPPDRAVQIEQVPLTPHASPVVDLRGSEFEAALMGASKQCLAPGEQTPPRSTRRYHELLLALDQPLIVKREIPPRESALQKDQAYYLPSQTVYRVRNAGHLRACFFQVYSLPEAPPDHAH